MNKQELQQFLEEYQKDIWQAASNLRNIPMPALTQELFDLYQQTGNRLVYEEVYFQRRKYLSVFGIAAILKRKKEDITVLEGVIREICAEQHWILPAHSDRDVYGDLTRYIDLFAAETAQTLGALWFSLKAELSQETRDLIRQEIERRVLEPFLATEPPYSNWEYLNNNWNAVCNGAMGSAALYLWESEPEKLKNCLKRIIKALGYYLDGFEEDGACPEGLSYFTYGMAYYTGFARQLKEYTAGEIDLLSDEKLANIARFQQACYFKGGLCVSFSDGNIHDYFRLGLSSFLAATYPEVRLPDIRQAAKYDFDTCFRFLPMLQDIFWTQEYLAKDQFSPEKPQITGRISLFPDAQWCIQESGNGCGMAVKGGNNDESHNHNDIGSFLYVAGEEMLLPDLGCGEYTREYFGPERYDILCCSSEGHNVPVISGQFQESGRQFRADSFQSDANGTVEISFAPAYYGDENKGKEKQICRILSFDQKTGILEVEDSFSGFSQTEKIEENLVSFIKPIITQEGIFLRGEQACVVVLAAEERRKVRILPRVHRKHDGTEITVYLMRWEISSKRKSGSRSGTRFWIEPLIKEGLYEGDCIKNNKEKR